MFKIGSLCWLILHVNVTGQRNAQVAAKTLLLSVSVESVSEGD